MLVTFDIRELFTLDLREYYAAVVRDFAYQGRRILEAKNEDNPNIAFDKDYFCSAFMFLNLELIRSIDFWHKCLHLLKNYKLRFPDQDILNAIFLKRTLVISFAYQVHIAVFTHIHPVRTCSDEGENYELNYTRAEFDKAVANIKIYHFSHPRKSWASAFSCPHFWRWQDYTPFALVDQRLKHGFFLWWVMAFQTPVFKEELCALKFELEKSELEFFALNLSARLKQEITTLQNHAYKTGATQRVKNHLAYQFGKALINHSKSFIGLMKLPFVLVKIYAEHSKAFKTYQRLCRIDESFKLPELESYADYAEALKIQNYTSYKFGKAFLKALKTWHKGGIFKFIIKALKKEIV